MTVLSKPPSETTSIGFCNAIPYSCYEVGHTWNSSCLGTYRGVFKAAFLYSLKIYITLYGLGGLWKLQQRKAPPIKILQKLIPEVLQSSFFLAMNAAYFLITFCAYRKIFGNYHGYSGYIVGFICSALSIVLERKSRREILAVYTLNLAMETIFNMLVSRGIFKPLPNGQVYLFALTNAVYMTLFRGGSLPESVQSIFENILGKSECRYSSYERTAKDVKHSRFTTLSKHIEKIWISLDKRLSSMGLQQSLCFHRQSCIIHALKGGLINFVYGYVIQVLLNSRAIVLNLVKGKPQAAGRYLLHFSLANFFFGYTAIFKMVNCILRWIFGADYPKLFGAISGLMAGLSSILYKSTTISMYIFSKLIEILCMKAVEARYLPYIRHADSLLYSLGLSVIFHAAIFEPHNIRPAYWRFLCDLSDNKFKEMFRILLDKFGNNASKLYPNFIPKLDRRYVVNEEVKRILTML